MHYVTTANDMVLRMCPGCHGMRNVWVGYEDGGDLIVACRTCQRVIHRVPLPAPAGKVDR